MLYVFWGLNIQARYVAITNNFQYHRHMMHQHCIHTRFGPISYLLHTYSKRVDTEKLEPTIIYNNILYCYTAIWMLCCGKINLSNWIEESTSWSLAIRRSMSRRTASCNECLKTCFIAKNRSHLPDIKKNIGFYFEVKNFSFDQATSRNEKKNFFLSYAFSPGIGKLIIQDYLEHILGLFKNELVDKVLADDLSRT